MACCKPSTSYHDCGPLIVKQIFLSANKESTLKMNKAVTDFRDTASLSKPLDFFGFLFIFVWRRPFPELLPYGTTRFFWFFCVSLFFHSHHAPSLEVRIQIQYSVFIKPEKRLAFGRAKEKRTDDCRSRSGSLQGRMGVIHNLQNLCRLYHIFFTQRTLRSVFAFEIISHPAFTIFSGTSPNFCFFCFNFFLNLISTTKSH